VRAEAWPLFLRAHHWLRLLDATLQPEVDLRRLPRSITEIDYADE
jgi:hypothetical protein